MWRIILGFGAIPGSFALYYRLTIPETPRYTFDVKHNIVKAVADSDRKGSAPIMEFYRYFKDWKQFGVLYGTVTSWFLLAVAFYGLNLNTQTILSLIGFGGKSSIYQLFYDMAVGQLILSAGSIPGYWFTIALADIIG